MTLVRMKKRPATSSRIAPISQTAEYALRAMAYLARPDAAPMRAVDLSQATQVPVHYLSKVLRRLALAGLLRSQKGHGGGFELTRPPTQIRFSDVLAAVDEAPSVGRCAFGWETCDARHPCPLHPAWSKLNEQMTAWAEQTTLADVSATSPVRLRKKPRVRTA